MSSARFVWELSRAVLADRDGIVAVIKAYFDESGIHDGSPVVTVGGYFGEPAAWRDFTKEWNRTKRPIKVFHAVDAQNLQGEFEGWSPEDRDELVKRLLPIIPKHPVAAVLMGINLDAFKEAMRGRSDLQEIFGTPYTACFQWALQSLVEHAEKFNFDERIACFHESNDFQREARESFDFIMNDSRYRNISSLTFGRKEDFVPLQAADILAYEGNKRLRDLSRPQRRSFAALEPDNGRFLFGMFDKTNMHKVVSQLEATRERFYSAKRAASEAERSSAYRPQINPRSHQRRDPERSL